MKRRFDKARKYHSRVFVRFTNPITGFVIERTFYGNGRYLEERRPK